MSDTPSIKTPVLVNGSEERRRFPRRAAGSISVSGPVTGEVVDMSEAGFAIETRHRPYLRREGVFRLDLGIHRPDFFGQVRWARLTGVDTLPNGESSPVYRAGIALVARDVD